MKWYFIWLMAEGRLGFKIILNDWSLEKISQFCFPRISLLATGNYESLRKHGSRSFLEFLNQNR